MGIENLKTVLKSHNKILSLKTPLLGASGTYGYNTEFEDFIDLNYLGGVVTKGITLEERLGNEGDRIFETVSGMINRIGLENVGIEKFLNEKLPVLKEKNIDFILNIAGSSFEDYEKLASVANENNIKALEVNVSCPNVQSGCLEFGKNPETLEELVKKIRKNYEGFLIIKLTPNVSDIKPLVSAVENGSADCISAVNTVHGLGIKLNYINKTFYKKTVQGGLSGKCIKPVSLYYVNQIRSVTKLPIIAIGGISSMNDVFEFLSVGADAVQIGTENFTNPSIISDIAKEIEEFIAKNGFKDFEELKQTIRGIKNE